MKIDSGSHRITIPIGYDSSGRRFEIESEQGLGGEGASCGWWPLTAFLVEWDWEGKARSRSVLMLPQKRGEFWLDDLVRSKAKEGYTLVGIMPVTDIELPAYVVPTEYRAEQEKHDAFFAQDFDA